MRRGGWGARSAERAGAARAHAQGAPRCVRGRASGGPRSVQGGRCWSVHSRYWSAGEGKGRKWKCGGGQKGQDRCSSYSDELLPIATLYPAPPLIPTLASPPLPTLPSLIPLCSPSPLLGTAADYGRPAGPCAERAAGRLDPSSSLPDPPSPPIHCNGRVPPSSLLTHPPPFLFSALLSTAAASSGPTGPSAAGRRGRKRPPRRCDASGAREPAAAAARSGALRPAHGRVPALSPGLQGIAAAGRVRTLHGATHILWGGSCRQESET